MHTLVRRFIKTAIAFLFVGLGIGGWMIVRRELYFRSPSPFEASAHTHAIAVGFVMMMILGVALWMFPRPGKGDTRYRPRQVEAAYWILTGATSVRIVSELMRSVGTVAGSVGTTAGVRWAVVLSSLGQVVGLALFFHAIWSRIRATGSEVRERLGEKF